MKGLRFSIGDIAVFAVARCSDSNRFIDRECIVRMIGPYARGQILPHPVKGNPCFVDADGDYVVVFANGLAACPLDWQLRKLDPPAEPESITRREDAECPA
ncbi:hypothetical protein [Pinirhizobacter sp.]|jgi:hypothetical protein|uniref:hypothetical protein n=1 Tax=Pinirhizobacter sp. TaxID=2950432 RepID=UPI002F400691